CIRDDIGQVVIPAGGTGNPEFLPNEGIPGVKPDGGVSETDIVNTLRFNNGLTLITVTAEELLALIEHGVAATTSDDGNTQGRFPQIAGFSFSFDVNLPPGDRVLSLAIEDEAGNDIDVVVQDGEIVGDSTRTFRMVTLGFLAGGGDGYPFPTGDAANRVDLNQDDTAPRTGEATFAPDGSEQDALAEYLTDNFLTTPFGEADTGRDGDTRIQNLAFRDDTVIDGPDAPLELVGDAGDNELIAGSGDDTVAGELGDDVIQGGEGDDVLRGDRNARSAQVGEAGGDDIIFGGAGNDRIGGKSGNDELYGEAGDDAIWGDDGDDLLWGGLGNDTLTGDNGSGGQGSDTFVLAAGEGTDTITDFEIGVDFIGLAGGLTADQLSFEGNAIKFGDETLAMLTGVADASGVDVILV
ncbi:MAG: multifunctional hydrolase/phosphatase/nucleotidase, partial [Leptolyngbya sp. SIO1D8]|nr:multifunctional hydrolase/phosphatase/nucleotidase [Leptolyngbya sp. SIO1D8]